jgi:hypothetical protein
MMIYNALGSRGLGSQARERRTRRSLDTSFREKGPKKDRRRTKSRGPMNGRYFGLSGLWPAGPECQRFVALRYQGPQAFGTKVIVSKVPADLLSTTMGLRNHEDCVLEIFNKGRPIQRRPVKFTLDPDIMCA